MTVDDAVLAVLRRRSVTAPGSGTTAAELCRLVLAHLTEGGSVRSGTVTGTDCSAACRRLARQGLARLESRQLGWHLTEAGRVG